MKSKKVTCKLWVEKLWVEAKRGSISGRQHDDVGYVEIYITPDDKPNHSISVRTKTYGTKQEMNTEYDRLREFLIGS